MGNHAEIDKPKIKVIHKKDLNLKDEDKLKGSCGEKMKIEVDEAETDGKEAFKEATKSCLTDEQFETFLAIAKQYYEKEAKLNKKTAIIGICILALCALGLLGIDILWRVLY